MPKLLGAERRFSVQIADVSMRCSAPRQIFDGACPLTPDRSPGAPPQKTHIYSLVISIGLIHRNWYWRSL